MNFDTLVKCQEHFFLCQFMLTTAVLSQFVVACGIVICIHICVCANTRYLKGGVLCTTIIYRHKNRYAK